MRVYQRLDTGMFYVKVNGEISKNGKGAIYFSDIRDAEKYKVHYILHSKAFQD